MHPEVSAIREANTIPDEPTEKAKIVEYVMKYHFSLSEALSETEIDYDKMRREGDSTLAELIENYGTTGWNIMEIIRNA
jgi:hypothetical protein